MKDINLIKQKETEHIYTQFEEIKQQLLKMFWNTDIKEINTENNFIESLTISFDNVKGDYSAYALSNIEPFDTEYENQNIIVFNADDATSYKSIIIHEIAHLIIERFRYIVINNHSGYHCLEFAIITYALQFRLLKSYQRFNKTFFRAYDIHEDIAYPNLAINVCKFDSLIKLIEWTTLEDLAFQADLLAKRIRQKIII